MATMSEAVKCSSSHFNAASCARSCSGTCMLEKSKNRAIRRLSWYWILVAPSDAMTVLGGAGNSFLSPKAGGGSGASGSRVSFWCSKISTFCGLPSSSTMKSFWLSVSMALPDLSSDLTSTITRFEFAENFGVAPAGCAVTVGCVCCPAAIKVTRMTIQRCRILETKPQVQAHGSRLRRTGRQAERARAESSAETGDLHVIQNVVGRKPQLQLLAALAEAPSAIQRGRQADGWQPRNGIPPGIPVGARCRSSERSLIEIWIVARSEEHTSELQ